MEEGKQQWYAGEQTVPEVSPVKQQGITLEPVSWSASEYVEHQKSVSWYVVLGCASAVVTLVIFIITQNIFSAVVVALACMALGGFAARQPQTKQFSISQDGVHCGDKFYPYGLFKSYSIVDDEALSCIWLRPMRRAMPTVVMYYAPDDEERIVAMLDNFLPQEDRQHDWVDRVSRRVRF